MNNKVKVISKILIIDTDEEILSSVSELLNEAGFTTIISNNSEQGIRIAQNEIPALVLMELRMPLIDGVDICLALRKIKELDQSFLVFYSSDKEDFAQIAAFDAGADDYILKPIKPRVLLSRLKALLKRNNMAEFFEIKSLARGLRIDRERYLVLVDEKEIILPKKEFELLSLLLIFPQKAYSRNEIAKSVWGKELDHKNRTIDVHIRHLRKKIGQKYIRTIKGVGYCLEL